MSVTGAPGFGFRKLLEAADQAVLRSLIDPKTTQLISTLDPEILTGERLRALVRDIRSSQFYLTDANARRSLLDLLPREKARELCTQLELPDAGDPHATLKLAVIPSGSKQEGALLSFFGAAGTRLPGKGANQSDHSCRPQYPLFSHQRDAAIRTKGVLESRPRRVLLHMPTGGGKTRTAMNLVADHFRSTEPTVVVWLAYSRELLEQAASEFENAWSRLGNRELKVYRFWGASTCNPLEAEDAFIVAGLGKLSAWSKADINSLPRLADRVSLTVMDEAHQSIAKTYSEMLNMLADKRPDSRLVGLSATPGRTWADIAEDEKLAEFFGRKKVTLEIPGYKNPVQYLMDKNYLARPQFSTLNREPGIQLSEADLSSLATQLDVPDEVLNRLADDEHRTLQIVQKVEDLITRHRRIILFATNVEHAGLIAAVLRARGRNAEAVTGTTPQHERQAILNRYTSNTTESMVICNFGVLTTGFDAPGTSAALIARPTRSLVLFSQMVGRAIRGRMAGGNDTAEIVTVIDPELPGFGDVAEAFTNWEDVWPKH